MRPLVHENIEPSKLDLESLPPWRRFLLRTENSLLCLVLAALVFGWERRRPIILVDLGALIEKGKLPVGLPAIPLQMGLQSLPPPLSEAPTNLERLAKYFFNVVYISRSGGVGLETLRIWLRKHKFPPGVPRVVKPGKRGVVAVLEDLKEQGFGNISAGIGRTRDFAETFAERRTKVVILSESGEERNFPRKTQWAKDWLEVRKKVQG